MKTNNFKRTKTEWKTITEVVKVQLQKSYLVWGYSYSRTRTTSLRLAGQLPQADQYD